MNIYRWELHQEKKKRLQLLNFFFYHTRHTLSLLICVQKKNKIKSQQQRDLRTF